MALVIFCCYLLPLLLCIDQQARCPNLLSGRQLVVDFEGVIVVLTNERHRFTQFSTNFFNLAVTACSMVERLILTSSFVVVNKVVSEVTILNISKNSLYFLSLVQRLHVGLIYSQLDRD